MAIDQMDRMLLQVAMARRTTGMAQRHGYVQEVQEANGERKMRLVLGFYQGQPWLSPWVHTEEHRGGSSSQQLVQKGQSMVYTCHGGDYRNATASPSGESVSNPQPHHAPSFNGDSTQNGKVRTATNAPSQNGGSGGGTSLLGTTQVLTPSGFKNIQDIKLGDTVLSCPTGSSTMKPVEDTVIAIQMALTKKPVYDLNYAGGKLCCTGEHGIWIESRRNYVAAEKLGFVDKLRDFDGKAIGISSLVPHEAGEWQTVYDLTVEHNGNFYARDGSDGSAILVHNQAGGGGGGGGGGSGGGSSHTHSIWIDNDAGQNPQHQDQSNTYDSSGSQQSSQQQGGQQSSQPNPAVIHHLNEDATGTIRTDTTARMMTSPKGSKLECKSGIAYAVVTPQGLHIVKKPWIIGKDPIPNNDSV